MFKNEWLLDVDLKYSYSSRLPVFRRGDTAILKFRIHDESVLYDISGYSDAEITIIMPSGLTLKEKCSSEIIDGVRVISFEFKPSYVIEIGLYNVILTLKKSTGTISIQPIKVRFFDNLNQSDLTFLELIQDLQRQITELDGFLDNALFEKDKGVAGGVATLDTIGKIPEKQLPTKIVEHVDKVVYLTGVHGLVIDEDGMAKYEKGNNDWQYVGFSDTCEGQGGRLQLSTSLEESIVTLEYFGTGYATLQKWLVGDKNITDFASNGKTFTGLQFEVSVTGIHTIYYNDDSNNEYVHKFNVTKDDLKVPEVKIEVEDGIVTVTPPQGTSLMKWDKGVRDVAYFQYNGTVITGNSFEVKEVGTYTIYYKLSSGMEYVTVFTVSEDMLSPIIKKPINTLSIGDLFKIGEITFQVLDIKNNEYFVVTQDYTSSRAFDTNASTKFNPTNPNNIAHYLNNEFYNDLITDEKDKIKLKNWGIGSLSKEDVGKEGSFEKPIPTLTLQQMKSKEDLKTAQSKVAIMSMSEFRRYSKTVKENGYYKSGDESNYLGIFTLPNYAMYTRTPLNDEKIYEANKEGTYYTINPAGDLYTFPVMWLDGSFIVDIDNSPPKIEVRMVESIAYLTISDESRLSKVRWDYGDLDVSYFTNNEGKEPIGTTYNDKRWIYSNQNGIATVFVEDIFGNKIVSTIEFPKHDSTPINVIESSFNNILKQYTGKEGNFTVSDGKSLIGLSGYSEKTLSDFVHFPNLEWIITQGATITDLSPVAYCPKIKEIWINAANVNDLSPLSTLTQLIGLTLYSVNNNTSLSPLKNLDLKTLQIVADGNLLNIDVISNMRSLISLQLGSNNINTTLLNTILTGKTKLERLNISSTSLQNLSFLNNTPNVINLTIYNGLLNLNGIENLTKLQYLSIYNTNITSLNGVGNLHALNTIDAINNLKLTSISSLSTLNNLTKIRLPDNNINSFTGVDRHMPTVNLIYLSGNATTNYPNKSNYPAAYYSNAFDW